MSSQTNMLKSTPVKLVSVQDWDDFVSTIYGKPYSFQQQDGCKERGIQYITVPDNWQEDFEETEIPFEVNGKEMGVSFQTWLNTSVEDIAAYFGSEWSAELFWQRNFYPNVGMIVNDLYSKGLLEAGKYIINIDW